MSQRLHRFRPGRLAHVGNRGGPVVERDVVECELRARRGHVWTGAIIEKPQIVSLSGEELDPARLDAIPGEHLTRIAEPRRADKRSLASAVVPHESQVHAVVGAKEVHFGRGREQRTLLAHDSPLAGPRVGRECPSEVLPKAPGKEPAEGSERASRVAPHPARGEPGASSAGVRSQPA